MPNSEHVSPIEAEQRADTAAHSMLRALYQANAEYPGDDDLGFEVDEAQVLESFKTAYLATMYSRGLVIPPSDAETD